MSKELPEVENVIAGPGNLLAEARTSRGLSVDDVAARLNFRVSLVKNMEADIYDKSLPDTFNRGYLKNYAKLLNIPNADVIGLYESMNGVAINPARMQSFSNGTAKKAQNNLLMWITYLILAIFIGFTVMWWLQDDDKAIQKDDIAAVENASNSEANLVNSNTSDELLDTNTEIFDEENNDVKTPEQQAQSVVNTAIEPLIDDNLTESIVSEGTAENSLASQEESSSAASTIEKAELTQVVFTFSGDCWVNIYDALGERIAWGIKKTGYVMTIDAQAPLKITIGKPELVKIDFGGESIDMSVYPEGHIAKLTLPLSSQS